MIQNRWRTLAACAVTALCFSTAGLAAHADTEEASVEMQDLTIQLAPELQGEREPVLRDGESLSTNQILQSKNKTYGFVANSHGEVTKIQWYNPSYAYILWRSGTNNVTKMTFSHGILSFLDKDGKAVWTSKNTAATAGQKSLLTLGDDGALFITIDDKRVWELGKESADPAPTPTPTPTPTPPAPGPGADDNGTHVLKPGNVLPAGSALASPNGRYYMGFHSGQNLSLLDRTANKILWRSGTQGHPGASKLIINIDGNVTLIDNQSHVLWQTNTAVSGAVNPRLVLRDTGALELMHGSEVKWTTRQPEVDGAKAVLKQGGELVRGSSLTSANQKYTLDFMTDGALMVHEVGGNRVVWEAAKLSGDPDKLKFAADGDLTLVAKDGKILWHTSTGKAGAAPVKAVIRDNGAFEVVRGTDVVWTSAKQIRLLPQEIDIDDAS